MSGYLSRCCFWFKLRSREGTKWRAPVVKRPADSSLSQSKKALSLLPPGAPGATIRMSQRAHASQLSPVLPSAGKKRKKCVSVSFDSWWRLAAPFLFFKQLVFFCWLFVFSYPTRFPHYFAWCISILDTVFLSFGFQKLDVEGVGVLAFADSSTVDFRSCGDPACVKHSHISSPHALRHTRMPTYAHLCVLQPYRTFLNAQRCHT